MNQPDIAIVPMTEGFQIQSHLGVVTIYKKTPTKLVVNVTDQNGKAEERELTGKEIKMFLEYLMEWVA